jgi:aryl-alcohol dehydrogenase-like predicted oxidoreductase
VREACAKAAAHCASRGVDIAQLALQFSIAHPDITTCVTGSANPERVREWARWAAEPMDQTLVDEVLQILSPIHDWFYLEGRPENNDPLP